MKLRRRAARSAALIAFAACSATARAPSVAHAQAVTPSAANAPPTTLDDALARIAKARTGLKSITGPFTQERTIGLLSAKVRSTGTLTLALPDRLRWELAAPDDVTYWVGPDGLAYRSKSGSGRLPKQAGPAGQSLDDLRVLLAGDLGSLRGRYDLRLVSSSNDETVFEATPLADAGAGAAAKVSKITFALGPDLVRPKRVTLAFGAKDRTVITFGDLKRDTPIDPALLKPPG